MRVVTGGKYPSNRWVVINDEDTEVLFDPAYAVDSRMFNKSYGATSLKICNVFVNSPEHRQELRDNFEDRYDDDDDFNIALIV